MNDEPTTTPISDDDNQPATKGFVRSEINTVKEELLEHITQTTERIMDHIAENNDKLMEHIATNNAAIMDHVAATNAKTMDHFDVVAENIHRDVAGANQDEITLIKDQQLPDHEKRIQALERNSGLPVA